MIDASHTAKRKALGTLRSEQKSYFLLRELLSRLSQSGSLVVNLLTGIFSEAVAFFTVSRHQVVGDASWIRSSSVGLQKLC